LLVIYEEWVCKWSDSAGHLAHHAGSNNAAYGSLFGAVEVAKAATARAQVNYTKHVTEHGC
jgi:hypothetical protein